MPPPPGCPPAAHMHTRSAHAWMSRSAWRALRQIACKLPKWVSGRDPARDHLAETIMVEAVAWSVKHSKSQKLHIVAFRAGERVQHSAQTGVSRPVVDDGDSFLDALFSSARQDRGTRQHPLQAEGRRRRTIGWRLAA